MRWKSFITWTLLGILIINGAALWIVMDRKEAAAATITQEQHDAEIAALKQIIAEKDAKIAELEKIIADMIKPAAGNESSGDKRQKETPTGKGFRPKSQW